MCLKAKPVSPVPELTKIVAESAFPKGNRYLRLRQVFDGVFKDDEFQAYYPPQGQPGYSPWRLALISVMQYMENLTDRQAADAVRARIDWKYALSLELTDTGFDASILSEFRKRLVAHQAEDKFFDSLLERFNEHGLLKSRGKQRTDSTAIWASVRNLNWLEHVGETMRYVLNDLSREAPNWLESLVEPEWLKRYGKRVDEYRLPKGKQARTELAEQIGQDGLKLLNAIENQPTLLSLPSVQVLQRTWDEQYEWRKGKFRWRAHDDLPPSSKRIHTPYDPEATYMTRHGYGWLGYRVHFTETCENDYPHLVVHVETTPATTNDRQVLRFIHEALDKRDLLPETQIVDTGYMQMDDVVYLQEHYQTQLLGPVQPGASWQAKAKQGYSNTDFQIDWERQVTTCPQGNTTSSWREISENGHRMIHIRFHKADCLACQTRALCTKSTSEPRNINIGIHHQQLQQMRQQQQSDIWYEQYADRAGIEATFSQVMRVTGLRQTRYIGLKKTHLHNTLSASALNLIRVDDWFNDKPIRRKRITPFQKLCRSMAS